MSGENLGFSVACYRGDLPLLRGCLASIRHFAPDAPICLIADGDFSTREFEKMYGLQVIRRKDVKNPDLRRWSFGYGFTKMAAFWEAPFEVVFHIDADAVMWGDVRKNLPPEPWDVVYNEPHEIITEAIQKEQYFDPERVFEHIEPFHWHGHPYFNSGALCCKRGVLDLDEYVKMLEIAQRLPGLFFQDQAMLNIMIFRALSEGTLVAKQAHLQTVVPVLANGYLESRFRFDGNGPVVSGDPTIIHWAGPKPWRENTATFREPMDHFRALGMKYGWRGLFPADLMMRIDEFSSRTFPKINRDAKSRIKRMIGIERE